MFEDLDHGGLRALVAITPTATSIALTGRSPWLFRVTPSDAAISAATAAYLADSLGARRAAIVYRNDSYGRDWTAAFVAAFRARGGTVVQRDPYVTGHHRMGGDLGVHAAHGADAVLFPGSADDAADFLRAYRRGGGTASFVGGDAVAPLAAQPEFAGARFATPYDAARAPRTAQAAAFVAAYQRALARGADRRAPRSPTTPPSCSATRSSRWGAIARGSGTGSPASGRTSPGIAGATGTIAFDEKHDARDRSVSIVTIAGRVRIAER